MGDREPKDEEDTEHEIRALRPDPGAPEAPIIREVFIRDEFRASLEQTFHTDNPYRRIVATAKDAEEFYRTYRAPSGRGSEVIELEYGELSIRMRADVILKMHAWVVARSCGFSLEVQGRFLAKRQWDHLFVNDFVPVPSLCQSLAYETVDSADRMRRFGAAKMRSIGFDDAKPDRTEFYESFGIFSGARSIPFDPYAVAIPFHSHYLKSEYQDGPSPGDHDAIFHIKWLFAPKTGKNILYSGVTSLQVDVPFVLPASSGEPVSLGMAPVNPGDVEIVVVGHAQVRRHRLKPGGLTIGRDTTCDVVIEDPDVSRTHARVFFGPSGELVVQDLESRNGSTIDSHPFSRHVVDAPCAIVIGNTTIKIVY